MSKVSIDCCDGNDNIHNQCLRDICPKYQEARRKVEKDWPYVGTGFGNLYGNPGRVHFLAKVRETILQEVCERAKRLHNTLGHGNGLDSDSMTFLATHMESCSSCKRFLTPLSEVEKSLG